MIFFFVFHTKSKVSELFLIIVSLFETAARKMVDLGGYMIFLMNHNGRIKLYGEYNAQFMSNANPAFLLLILPNVRVVGNFLESLNCKFTRQECRVFLRKARESETERVIDV